MGLKNGSLFLFLIAAIVGLLFIPELILEVQHSRDSRVAKRSLTLYTLVLLSEAVLEYHKDYGCYPADSTRELDKCGEALYYQLSGSKVDSPDLGLRRELREQRKECHIYLDVEDACLMDFDRDGFYEIVDAWGRPIIYLRSKDNKGCRIYSLGPDGRTGRTWEGTEDLSLDPKDHNSFYYQAANEPEDGDTGSGARYSCDDINRSVPSGCGSNNGNEP